MNMANNPKKVKDPTEVALSAIQEALNISDTSIDTSRNSIGGELSSPTMPSPAPTYSETAFDSRGSTDRPVFDLIEEPRGPRRAANDDRETIGQIPEAIEKSQPARSVYTLASVFGGVWVVGCGLLTVSFLPALQAAIGQSGGVLVLAGLAALFFAPVLLFYFLAKFRLARPGNADDRAVDGAGRDPLLRARGRCRRFDGDRRAGDPPRSRRDGRRRRACDRARRRTGNACRQ